MNAVKEYVNGIIAGMAVSDIWSESFVTTVNSILELLRNLGELRMFTSNQCTAIYNQYVANGGNNYLMRDLIDTTAKVTAVNIHVSGCSSSKDVLEYRAQSILVGSIQRNKHLLKITSVYGSPEAHQRFIEDDLTLYDHMMERGLYGTREAINAYALKKDKKTIRIL